MEHAIQATRFIFLAFGIAISSWAPMIPFVKSRLVLNEAELGFILLLFGIGAIITMPISGWLISRMGSRLLTLVSGLFMLAIIPFLAIAPTFFFVWGNTLFFWSFHKRYEHFNQCSSPYCRVSS